jgi:hypothetical protein
MACLMHPCGRMQMFSPSNLRRARRSTGGKSPRGSRTSAAAAAAAAPHAPEDEADYFDLTEQVFFGESGGVNAVAVRRTPDLTRMRRCARSVTCYHLRRCRC